MGKYNDAAVNIYVNMAKDDATKKAVELSVAANKASLYANVKGTRANHIKAERAHQDAAKAWLALPGGSISQEAAEHERQANIHFLRAQ